MIYTTHIEMNDNCEYEENDNNNEEKEENKKSRKIKMFLFEINVSFYAFD